MYDYAKLILLKVSFNPFLFSHELKKFVAILSPEENLRLETWCIVMFGAMYAESIKEAFQRCPEESGELVSFSRL